MFTDPALTNVCKRPKSRYKSCVLLGTHRHRQWLLGAGPGSDRRGPPNLRPCIRRRPSRPDQSSQCFPGV